MSGGVERVDPRLAAERIRALFLTNDSPGAAKWFDRTFLGPLPVEGSSWIVGEPEGNLHAHVAMVPSRLFHAGRELRGAVLCNLMADKERRTFFPALAVMKGAMKDLRAEGIDYVISNPSNAGAVAIAKGAGLRPIGNHSQYILPLGDKRRLLDVGFALYLAVRRLMVWRRFAIRRVEPAVVVCWTLDHPGDMASVAARREAWQYAQRHESFGGADDHGYMITDQTGTEVAGAVVRVIRAEHRANVITLRSRTAAQLPAAVLALGSALRAEGYWRLSLLAVAGSVFARGLRRGGCFVVPGWTVVGVGFTDAGIAAVAALGDSDLERMDLD